MLVSKKKRVWSWKGTPGSPSDVGTIAGKKKRKRKRKKKLTTALQLACEKEKGRKGGANSGRALS